MPAAPPQDELPALVLRRGEERRIADGHLWVWSNEIDSERTPLSGFEPGTLCRLLSSREQCLGVAYVNPASLICARLMTRTEIAPRWSELTAARLRSALAVRERLFAAPFYRLAYGESDLLPGLVLDRYGEVIVGQIGTAGMERLRGAVTAAVAEVLPGTQLVWKNDGAARELEGLPAVVEAEHGALPAELEVHEGDARFRVPFADGQKTGWFYDQSANRRALTRYARGARVLDVCSYVGGWAVTALRAGAREAWCVDSSATALDYAERNAAANSLALRTVRGDAFDVLAELDRAGERFDLVVLDPPAFIKKKKQIPKGEAAYRKLNLLGMQLLAPGGTLVSCSCSWHLAPESLVSAIQRAARHTGRLARIVETGGQAADHPVHPAIPETRYLKAYFVTVD